MASFATGAAGAVRRGDKEDPQIWIGRLVRRQAEAAARVGATLGAVYVDRADFDAVCRAYAVDPRKTGGLMMDKVKIAALQLCGPGEKHFQ